MDEDGDITIYSGAHIIASEPKIAQSCLSRDTYMGRFGSLIYTNLQGFVQMDGISQVRLSGYPLIHEPIE